MRKTSLKQKTSSINSPFVHDLMGLLCIFLGAFTALSLCTYSSGDPSWFTASSHPARNLAGLVGSYWSALLVQTLGGSAFLLCMLFFLASAAIFRRITRQAWALTFVNYFLLLAMTAASLSFLRDHIMFHGTMIPLGGVIGKELKKVLQTYLNVGGASLVTLFLFVLALSLSTQISIRDMALHIWWALSTLILKFSTLAIQAALHLGKTVRAFSLSAWNSLKALFFHPQGKQSEAANAKIGTPGKIPPPETAIAASPMKQNLIQRFSSCIENFIYKQGGTFEKVLFEGERNFPEIIERSVDSLSAGRVPEPEIVTLQPATTFDSNPAKKSALLDYVARAAKANEKIIRRATGKTEYVLPPPALLRTPVKVSGTYNRSELIANSHLLEEKIKDFKIQGSIAAVKPGPVITIYEFKPGTGVKVNTIANLADDLALALSAQSVRIEAPIPGRDVVGIEVPNSSREEVFLKEIVDTKQFRDKKFSIPIAIGKDTMGEPVIHDLKKMPHMLVAGATGSGKSVFINTLICSLLYRFTPHELKLILVDPKQLELAFYESIPHLLLPVVTEAKNASLALRWAVGEMERRYQTIARSGMRDVDGYNQKLSELGEKAMAERLGLLEEERAEAMPKIVIVIDELADLMMTARSDVENNICRLAQKARAAGIHLVLATQRPSVDVITGLIKANLPARLSFRLSSKNDSRTIFDTMGAERLVGNGDMLFMPPGESRLVRMHGAYISEAEIEAIAQHWKSQGEPEYREEILDDPESEAENGVAMDSEGDALFDEAVDIAVSSGAVSASMLQRRFRIGYNRAARMVEMMEARGIVTPADGAKPRTVLIQK